MKHVLVLSLLFLVTGCYANPTPTPYPLQQYPATWTPAPTPTNTPPGPTATLVIQKTPGAPPTRDPNLRLLPAIPRKGIGLWLEINANTSDPVRELAPRAQIVVTHDEKSVTPRFEQQQFLATRALTQTTVVETAAQGILLETLTAENAAALAELRDTLKPRLLLVAVPVTDTTAAQTILPNTDGLLLENFLRDANAPPEQFPDVTAWKRDVNTLAELSSNGRAVILTSTRFPDKDERPLPVVQQWANFALASFLLGANNTHTFFGMPDARVQQFVNVPALNVDLGTPTGGMTLLNGVYQRRYTRGLVYVNPSNEKRTFLLPVTYTSATGNPVTGLEMLPHTGTVLTIAQ